MPRRLALLSLFVALAFLPSPSAAAKPVAGYPVTTVSHGIRLALSLPHNAYPRNALVRVTVVARNITRKPVNVIRENNVCGRFNPYVEVRDSTGNVSQLPTLARFFPPPCPAPLSDRLLPGHAIKRQRYVILSDRTLVATIMVGSLRRPITYLSTPSFSVSLSAGQAPHVMLHVDGEQAFADVAPAEPTKGPLRFIQSAQCPTNGGFEVVTHYDWQPADGTRITAGCSPLSEWHAIAGWLNQPVATIDYAAPANTTGIAVQPHSPRVEQGKAYPFDLHTHCGVDFFVDFDGSFWDLADPAWVSSEGNPPPGIGNPSQEGTMTVLDGGHARFDFSGGHILFTRHVGPKIMPGPCS